VVLVLKTSQGGLFTLPHVDELRSRGHDVVAVLPATNGNLRDALAERGVTIVDSPFDFRFRPTYSAVAGLVRLRRKLRELAPDVLHYHLYASALATRLASLRLGIPRIHMVAGPLYLDSPLIRAAERWLVRLDTVTIGGSEFTSRLYRQLGRTAEQTPTIHYGTDTQHFRSLDLDVRTRVRTELGIAPGDFVAVMVALVYGPKRLVHAGRGIKGHNVLLEAWRQFRTEHPASHLILVSGGFTEASERHRRELIARFHLEAPDSGVTWLGTTTDVRPYYAAADVSVSPSLSENHGAAREACAMGVPSIVSDAGALPETVEPRSGWIVPPDDSPALVAALCYAHAEHLRGDLASRGEQARQLALRRFDEAPLAAAVADVIERTATRTPTRIPFRLRRGPAVFSVFTEARFAARADGRWTALDPASRGEKVDRYTRDGNKVRLVARACHRQIAESAPVPDYLTIVPIPYYVGVTGLLRRLFPVIRSVWRAVADAETIVLRVPGVGSSIGAVVCRLLRRAYAVEVVGDPVDVLRAGVLGRVGQFLAPLSQVYMRWLVRHAAASLFVTRQTLQNRYPPRPGTPTASMSNVVLGPGMPAGHSRNWTPGPFHIVTIGSQETHYKGHDVLLRALRELIDSGIDVTATVVGGGRMHGELVELSRSLGLTERVTFTGVVDDRAHILDLLDSASIFAMPSRTEGVPQALIEAMARAVPAVASRIGGIPELLDTSALVPVGDHGTLSRAIGHLLSNPELWEEQSRDNLKIAEAYEKSLLDDRFSNWLARVPPARRIRERRHSK
jgi:glycosyltransferase involved in cell wall biosynthesis